MEIHIAGSYRHNYELLHLIAKNSKFQIIIFFKLAEGPGVALGKQNLKKQYFLIEKFNLKKIRFF